MIAPQTLSKIFYTSIRRISSGKTDYDVIINGGSIVGASLALDLLNSTKGSLKICIIDQTTPPKLEDCHSKSVPDLRTYALSPSSVNYLEKLDAWKHVLPRAQPYKSMQIWESRGRGLVRFHASELNVKQLGYITEDSTVLAAIYKSIHEHSNAGNVHMLFGSSILSINKIPEQSHIIELTVSEKASETLSARLLIGADGANSSVRNLADISTYGWSYGQEAVVATVKVDYGVEDDYDGMTAYQRYMSFGPIAMLPLWDNYCSIVWSMPVSESQRMKSLPKDKLLAEMNDAFSSPIVETVSDMSYVENDGDNYRFMNPLKRFRQRLKSSLDGFISTGLIIDRQRKPPLIKDIASPKVVSFPLQFRQASKYISNRVALAGDAAHSIHPQAGQGLNLGLADVQCLSSTIINAIMTGNDYGSIAVLQPYEDKRYAANLAMMGTVDALDMIFKDNLFPSKEFSSMPMSSGRNVQMLKQYTRSLGMIGIHNFPSIKNRIAKFATGLDLS